jgi:hypothetical protein
MKPSALSVKASWKWISSALFIIALVLVVAALLHSRGPDTRVWTSDRQVTEADCIQKVFSETGGQIDWTRSVFILTTKDEDGGIRIAVAEKPDARGMHQADVLKRPDFELIGCGREMRLINHVPLCKLLPTRSRHTRTYSTLGEVVAKAHQAVEPALLNVVASCQPSPDKYVVLFNHIPRYGGASTVVVLSKDLSSVEVLEGKY